MCIAIYKPAGKVIDRDTLHRCYLKNKDGCGFAYFKTDGTPEGRELVIVKSMNFQEFYEDYEFHSVLNSDRPFLIHFRIATHGTVNLFNCHPFKIDDSHVMIHNGIIHNIRNCPDKMRSDTQMFVDDILKELPSRWMVNLGITNLIEDYIGASKVVVLAADDTVTIYNEAKGEWAEDIWYSNSGYKEVKVYTWDKSDYYGSRYSDSKPKQKDTAYNYERPNVNKAGETIGTLYGRWTYCAKTNTHEWIEAERPVDHKTPGAVWAWDAKKGAMGWVVVTDDSDPQTVKVTEWTYQKDTGLMCEVVDGVMTGATYPAGHRTKQKHLALVEQKQLPPPEREYETCCSCCQVLQTDELFVVDEFRETEDCFICQRCLDEYVDTGMAMTNPIKVSDIKLLDREIENLC